MPRYTIVPIVEGHGEFFAVPVLIRRWLEFRNFRNFEVKIDGPIRASGKGSLTVPYRDGTDLGVESFVLKAVSKSPDAILVMLDADKQCPATLGQALLARARSVVANDIPIGIVVANREYEAWFLAAFGSPVFRRRLIAEGYTLTRQSIPRGLDVEGVSGCKTRIAEWLGIDNYGPTIHQIQLSRLIPFTRGVLQRSRSFRKLLKELETLTAAARARRG
jgi:hypothetical protein